MKREASAVAFGTTTIPYRIERRAARVKTVALRIEGARDVLLLAPRGAPVARLDAIVRAKARWILAQLRTTSDRPPPSNGREFVSGETFVYAGRQHRLRVVVARTESVSLEHGRLVVRVQARGGRVASRRVRALVVTWYRARAEKRTQDTVAAWAPRVGVRPTRVCVVDQRSRWGSCSSAGELRFNWRIVGASKRLVEYVVVHELVHLLHADHTPAFWRRLGEVMPDYEGRRARLRELGDRLVW